MFESLPLLLELVTLSTGLVTHINACEKLLLLLALLVY